MGQHVAAPDTDERLRGGAEPSDRQKGEPGDATGGVEVVCQMVELYSTWPCCTPLPSTTRMVRRGCTPSVIR